MSESSDGIGLIQTNMKQHISITIGREGSRGTGISIITRREGSKETGISMIWVHHIVYISMAMANNWEVQFDLRCFSISFVLFLLGWRLVRGAIEGRWVEPCAWVVGFGCSTRNGGSRTSDLDGGGVVTEINGVVTEIYQNHCFMVQGHRSPFSLQSNTSIDEAIHNTKNIEYVNKFKSKFMNNREEDVFDRQFSNQKGQLMEKGKLSGSFYIVYKHIVIRLGFFLLYVILLEAIVILLVENPGVEVLDRLGTNWASVVIEYMVPVSKWSHCDKYKFVDTENRKLLMTDCAENKFELYEIFVEVICLLLMIYYVRITIENLFTIDSFITLKKGTIILNIVYESFVYGSGVIELLGLFASVPYCITNTISKGELCLSHPVLVIIMGSKYRRVYMFYWNVVTNFLRGNMKMRLEAWKCLLNTENPWPVLSSVVQTQIWVLFKWEDLWCSTLRQVMVSSATMIKYLLLVLGFCSGDVGVVLFTGVRKGARGFVHHVGSLWRAEKTCDLQTKWYFLSTISTYCNLRRLQWDSWMIGVPVSLNSFFYVNIVTLNNRCNIVL